MLEPAQLHRGELGHVRDALNRGETRAPLEPGGKDLGEQLRSRLG